MANDSVVRQQLELDVTSDAPDENLVTQRVLILTPDGSNAMKLQAQATELIMAAIADYETRIATLEGQAEDFETRIAALEA